MDAPECPFCKKKEWRHICDQTLTNVAAAQKADTARTATGDSAIPKTPVSAATPFDRKKYQREYMRKWRAKR